MPEKEGVPVQGARSFDLLESLGKIEGLLSGLVDKTTAYHTTTLHNIDCIPGQTPIMSAKNKLVFRGSSDDDAEEFIKKLKYLQMANGWDDKKMFGNALFSLADHARHWYEREPLESFCDEGQTTPKFKHFEKVFLAKFKKDETQSDVMCEVLNAKQQRGQSVTDYLSVVLPLLARLEEIGDEFKCGIVLNGFLPSLKNQLVLKEIKTLADLELWAKRIEKLNYVQKSVSTVESESTEEEVATVNSSHPNQGARPKIHVPPVSGARSKYQGNYNNNNRGNNRSGQFQRNNFSRNKYQQNRNTQAVGNFMHRPSQASGPNVGPCFTCGGPHFRRSCPQTNPGYRQENTQYYQPGPCFICGGPHFQRTCQYNRPQQSYRGGRQQSYRSYRNMSAQGRQPHLN